MSRISSAAQMLLGLALLLALVAALGWLAYTTVTEAPAVVAAVMTGVLAILGLGVQRFLEQQREDERIRREQMAPIYEELVGQLHQIAEGSVGPTDVESFFKELARSLQLWGSPPVIEAFNTWRAMAIEHAAQNQSGFDMLLAYEDLAREGRPAAHLRQRSG